LAKNAAALDAAQSTCASLEAVVGKPNVALLSEEQVALATSLLRLKQDHLFEDWPEAGSDDTGKIRLMEQLQAVDAVYPGGLAGYITKAVALLESSAAGTNPFEGYAPSVPEGEDLLYGDEEYHAMEAKGLEAAAKLGFVLVAGGLGERLGYSGIKVALPVELASEKSFLQMYADWILALQSRVRASTGDVAVELPLAIMTSGDTDAPTRALLEAEGYMGLAKSQVTIMMQDKVPALQDNLARLVVDGKDRWSLATKPHGHGDVHHLLHRTGLAKRWKEQGKEWVFFFQDTNPLVIHALVPMLGVSVDRHYDMNSLCVPRRAGEAAGAITKLQHIDGHDLTINVEYNQLDPLLRATPGYEKGDVDDPETGFSPFPGNVNNLLVYLPSYERVISGPDAGVVEEFVNPKYKDMTRTAFKKPTRLECMMQDFPKLLAKELRHEAKVGFTTMERWLTFSPAKNDPVAGATSAAKGAPPGSPSSSEADFYEARRITLEKVTDMTLERGEEKMYAGMPLVMTPAVVFAPSFAVTSEEVARKVKGGKISARSVLVVEGEGVALVENLELDGALVISAAPGATVSVKGLKVQNKGWEWKELASGGEGDASVPEELRIRGFEVAKHETMEVFITEAGDWVVDADGEVHKV
jgi:UDP-sugar pyrophosphorylase